MTDNILKDGMMIPVKSAGELLQRLWQPAIRGMPRSWTKEMSLLLLALLLILPVLHLADAFIVRWAANSTAIPMQILRSCTDLIRTVLWIAISLLVWVATAIWLARSPQVAWQDLLLRLHGWATMVLLSTAVGSLFTEPLKLVVGRARPLLLDQLGPLYFVPFKGEFLYESFPSGHSMTAGIMLVSLWIFFPRGRWITAPVCLLFAFSRLAAGVHFPTDVAAGFAIGAFSTIWVARLLAQRNIILVFSGRKLLPVY